ncbi:MAG: diguanylate cyclase [Candidatus Tectomicrobia bacterium]|nr:diguanylate cyclase [Candidatus Tectomicrobia bacterium]
MLEPQTKRVLLVDPDRARAQRLGETLSAAGYYAYDVEDERQALDLIYNEPPDLILIDYQVPEEHGGYLCQSLKTDNVYSHLPIILILPQPLQPWNWESLQVEDFLVQPFSEAELLLRTSLCFARTSRALDANPLTRLPGNHSIIREIERRIAAGAPFALCYLDLDHFKGYNDYYGFTRGDEVLSMTARLITMVVRGLNCPEGYAGHIGGDDFVFIVPADRADEACQQIIRNFDLIVANFYDVKDRLRGYIEAVDRQGQCGRVPLLTVSIAVVTNEGQTLQHYGEFSSVASELKKYAKSQPGSVYVKDRRRDEPVGAGLASPAAP